MSQSMLMEMVKEHVTWSKDKNPGYSRQVCDWLRKSC